MPCLTSTRLPGLTRSATFAALSGVMRSPGFTSEASAKAQDSRQEKTTAAARPIGNRITTPCQARLRLGVCLVGSYKLRPPNANAMHSLPSRLIDRWSHRDCLLLPLARLVAGEGEGEGAGSESNAGSSTAATGSALSSW